MPLTTASAGQYWSPECHMQPQPAGIHPSDLDFEVKGVNSGTTSFQPTTLHPADEWSTFSTFLSEPQLFGLPPPFWLTRDSRAQENYCHILHALDEDSSRAKCYWDERLGGRKTVVPIRDLLYHAYTVM
jgi:hypothetical protein